jgi:hypothetical protein
MTALIFAIAMLSFFVVVISYAAHFWYREALSFREAYELSQNHVSVLIDEAVSQDQVILELKSEVAASWASLEKAWEGRNKFRESYFALLERMYPDPAPVPEPVLTREEFLDAFEDMPF